VEGQERTALESLGAEPCFRLRLQSMVVVEISRATDGTRQDHTQEGDGLGAINGDGSRARTSQVYDLCEKMSSALFEIWLELKSKQDPSKRKELCRTIDEIEFEYRNLRRGINTPVPLPEGDSGRIMELPEESPPIATHQPEPIFESTLSEREKKILCKAQSGMVLNLR
jgi:hypothetical protein